MKFTNTKSISTSINISNRILQIFLVGKEKATFRRAAYASKLHVWVVTLSTKTAIIPGLKVTDTM